MVKRFLGVVLAACLLGAGVLSAQTKSYHYDTIYIDVGVNGDSTVDIVERQTFNYTGKYNAGWRRIPLRKISRITDIVVVDGATGQSLVYSSDRLDSFDPNSWGQYTTFRENGAQNIEWYYNLADTTHEWVIKYRVHGALSFLKNLDELYWNLFTDYDVPVIFTQATVRLPGNGFDVSDMQITGYASSVSVVTEIADNQTFHLRAQNISAGEDLTIAAGWPRGLVDRGAFWRGWLMANWSTLLAGLIVLATAIYTVARWYWLEKRPEWSRTIVPEYEPPQKLKPAMAELIVKERMSHRAWPATIVDLAVRGYIKISQVPSGFFSFGNKYYQLDLLKDLMGDLEDYEQEFLNIIFQGKATITTKDLRKRAQTSWGEESLRYQMQELQKKLYTETGQDTKAYDIPLRRWHISAFLFVFFFFWASLFFGGFLSIAGVPFGLAVLFFAILLSALWLWQLKHNPRLSPAGVRLKQDWLGFILYLKTAERYRLQNLTPDLFEKFLPYAIIFGVEKQWGRAFDSFSLPGPGWYHGAGGGFSAATFPSSFASSFSSSFASSFGGSGGASGGGGGAGGGGGGGGGGAR